MIDAKTFNERVQNAIDIVKGTSFAHDLSFDEKTDIIETLKCFIKSDVPSGKIVAHSASIEKQK